ncbi:hypothetical protein R7Y11_03445 [Mesomycoplasma ovipneumoniae]|uniref:hypothetical protein n=1 Tax=Mesomycoplasma ovipneumoniae TaxID=29562 RepID=UPI00296471E1|nr:hypothetical protein [Mesomycoplasma ovipneumoniae]MDW2925227.1 hypothetical protein [Mesomycoplasma ovipneumoniae]
MSKNILAKSSSFLILSTTLLWKTSEPKVWSFQAPQTVELNCGFERSKRELSVLRIPTPWFSIVLSESITLRILSKLFDFKYSLIIFSASPKVYLSTVWPDFVVVFCAFVCLIVSGLTNERIRAALT